MSVLNKYIRKSGLFIFWVIFTLGLSLSCKKYTTPKKVARVIVVDSWTIQSFFFEGLSITNDFSEHVYAFDENNTVQAKGIVGSVGTWTVGLNKNPATLYLSNFFGYPMSTLNDDWTVDSCSKEEIKLSSGENSVVLKKVDD